MSGRFPMPFARHAVRVLIALAFVVGSVLVDPAWGADALTPATHAAETDLTLVTNAQYDVQPAQQRVRITLDVTASNRKRDTVTKRFFFERAFLAVQPGTTGFAVVSPARAKVSVARRTKQFTLLRIDFGQRLYGGRNARLRIRFDLPDPGGAATRPIRIGDALVSFPVWAYASDGARGSQVSVSFPKDYEVTVESGQLGQRTVTEDGRTVLRSGPLTRPTSFFAYVVGDRPGAYRDTALTVPIAGQSVPLVLRAWVDDPQWATRVGELFRNGLPIMADAIGRPWDWTEPVVVAEGASRSKDADAGLFDPAAGRIEIAYYADAFVVLHEAAHGWFNGRLLADRWANEGFASYYAERALTKLEVKAPIDTLTDELLAVRIPLNAWSVADDTDPKVIEYGYAASLELARRIVERAGDEGLQEVWRDAATGVAAYPPDQGRAVAEPTDQASPPDWRGFLDLLEERTGKPFDDLWREWVVRPEEVAILDARIAARESYERTVALADGWRIPQAARDAMRAWQFDAAETLLGDTRIVIAQRETLEAAAARSGLELPTRFREIFEDEADLVAASDEAVRQLAVIDALDAATGTKPAGDDPLVSLGLIGIDPVASLADARLAFSEGRLEDALASAAVASTDWRGAWDEGRRRLLVLIALVATTMVLGSAAIGWMRRRHLDPASSLTSG